MILLSSFVWDQMTPVDHNVNFFHFWATLSCKKILCELKYFLIGKIMFLMNQVKIVKVVYHLILA